MQRKTGAEDIRPREVVVNDPKRNAALSRCFFSQRAALGDNHTAGEAGDTPGVLIDGNGDGNGHRIVQGRKIGGHAVADTDCLHQAQSFIGSFRKGATRNDRFACAFIGSVGRRVPDEVQTRHFDRAQKQREDDRHHDGKFYRGCALAGISNDSTLVSGHDWRAFGKS